MKRLPAWDHSACRYVGKAICDECGKTARPWLVVYPAGRVYCSRRCYQQYLHQDGAS